MSAIHKTKAETGERKGGYLNVTAPTSEQIYKRAEYANSLGAPIICTTKSPAAFSPRRSPGR